MDIRNILSVLNDDRGEWSPRGASASRVGIDNVRENPRGENSFFERMNVAAHGELAVITGERILRDSPMAMP